MKMILIAGVALALAGCATVHETYAPDGRKAYTLNCSGLARGWDKCFDAAGERCGPAGYDVIDRTGEDSGFVSATSTAIVGAHGLERSMTIACKVPPT